MRIIWGPAHFAPDPHYQGHGPSASMADFMPTHPCPQIPLLNVIFNGIVYTTMNTYMRVAET